MRYPGAEWRPISINYRSGGNIPTLMIMHVMQGTLAGSDSWFRDPRAQVSAHFGVGKGGTVYQWVDTHDTAWHAMAANHRSIGVEHEGDTGEHLTAAQVEADEKLFAWATEHHAIPMSLAHSPEGSGLAYHALGSSSWGGTCSVRGSRSSGSCPRYSSAPSRFAPGEVLRPPRPSASGNRPASSPSTTWPPITSMSRSPRSFESPLSMAASPAPSPGTSTPRSPGTPVPARPE
jgi:hypothetical protein